LRSPPDTEDESLSRSRAGGAIHGCELGEEDSPLISIEDVGRYNAVDKIAGYLALNNIAAHDKIFYATGGRTSEMVFKTVK